MKYLIAVICFFQFILLSGQEVKIVMDADVEQKISIYNTSQSNINTIQVYRIQFGVTSDRRAMETELSNFESEFNLKTDWNQKGPYYYMKAGTYRSKLESFPDMKAIQEKYSGAIYLVENVRKQYILE